jgi:uncharacterized protein (DUF736 family)
VPEYDNEMKGVLFPNEKRSNDRAPNATGTIQIKGVTYKLAGWTKEAKNSGKKFMSITAEEQDTDGVNQDRKAPAPPPDNSGIPF